MKTFIQFLAFIFLGQTIYSQSGTLDTTFDLDGKKVISFATPNDYGEFVIIQPDNKIIVGGRSSLTGGYLSFSLARMNPSGSFDSSFGTSGKVTTSYGTDGFEAVSGALQQDGKIIVVGNAFTNASLGYSQIALVRYNSDGTLDNSFDSDGMVFTQVPSSNEDFVKSVKIQTDGKILVGIQSRINFDRDFVLARYNTDGILDSTFGTNGISRTLLPTSNEAIYDIALQNDGKIIAGGTISGVSNDDIAVFRYNSNGTIDTSFATNGKFIYDFAANHNYVFGVALTSDNKIVLVGRYQNGSSSSPFVARLNSDGTFDTAFDSDGILIQTTDEMISDVVLQSDNKIITAGTSNGKFGVWKLNTDGTFDATFGSNGKVETLVNINSCVGNNVALQPDGKIVVVGSTYGNPFMKYGVVRYNNDAPLNTNSFLTSNFKMYPNPSNGKLFIEVDEEFMDAGISIYNLLGQKTKTFKIDAAIKETQLDKGIYFVELKKQDFKILKKVIVN